MVVLAAVELTDRPVPVELVGDGTIALDVGLGVGRSKFRSMTSVPLEQVTKRLSATFGGGVVTAKYSPAVSGALQS